MIFFFGKSKSETEKNSAPISPNNRRPSGLISIFILLVKKSWYIGRNVHNPLERLFSKQNSLVLKDGFLSFAGNKRLVRIHLICKKADCWCTPQHWKKLKVEFCLHDWPEKLNDLRSFPHLPYLLLHPVLIHCSHF